MVSCSSSSSNLGTGFTRECIRFRENFAQCRATQQSSTNYIQVGAGLVVVRTRLEGAPESLYGVGRSCISWQLIKAIFASSPAVVGLDILVAVYIN